MSAALVVGLAWRFRSRRAQALQHPIRQSLLEAIRRSPGARPVRLQEAVEANRGTINYHLMILEKAGTVRVLRRDHCTRFFPAETDLRESSELDVLLQGRVMEMVNAIVEKPGVSQKEMTKDLPMSRKVFRKYANLLSKQKLVEEVRSNRLKKYYPTPELLRLRGRGPSSAETDGRP